MELFSGCIYYAVDVDVSAVSLWQEMARLLMEQEKKEYRKNREREKEKERERERLAMDRMAMERRRQEGDYRVIFCNHTLLNFWGGNIFAAHLKYISLFSLWYKNLNFRFNFIFVGFQPNVEEVVRPRTRDEYEYQRQRNHNKPARYKTHYFVRTNVSSQPKSRYSIITLIFFLCFLLSQASSASGT